MLESQIVLTDKDREELTPLLHASQAARALMPEEVLLKLDLLAKEQQEGGFKEFENIIEESLSFIETK